MKITIDGDTDIRTVFSPYGWMAGFNIANLRQLVGKEVQ